MMKLTQSLIPVVRRKMAAEQGNLCLLCREHMEDKQMVLDHDHDTGHCRGVLHRGCNAMLGHLENNRARHLLKDDDKFATFLANIMEYINMDCSHQPLHSTHKNTAEKKAASYEKSRKKLVASRIASNPTAADAIKAKEKALRKVRADRNRPTVKSSKDI